MENLLEFSEKIKFLGDIFGKFLQKLKKLRKNWFSVGKFLSFLTNMLEFLGKIT